MPTDDVAPFLEDAAHFPGGHAAGVVFPRNAEEIAEALSVAASVLPIGAQSSLTGGATPFGETVLSTSRMTRILDRTASHVRVQPGVTIGALQDHLAGGGAWFPPAPTFTGACAGGIVATNAAGAATFKYGAARHWVEGLTVVLADGTILELQRGRHRAHRGEIEIATRSGPIRIPIPRYRPPEVPKCSAGYHAEPDMDLVDLFIGSEATLGVVADVTFRILSPAPSVAHALITCTSDDQALNLVTALRAASRETWREGDPLGIDVSAIEHMDHRSIEIAVADGAAERRNVTLPSDSRIALLVQLELPATTNDGIAIEEIASALDGSSPDTPLTRFCRMLNGAALLHRTEIALPSQQRRIADFLAVREAVPAGVNQRVGHARRTIDDRISKTAADMIVPFERFGEMMDVYRRGFESRGLDYAIWGHISDGNVHPNIIPRSYDDVAKGREAILEFGREVHRLGGSPLAEHGVGRSPVKQALLEQMYGPDGIEQMRAVKRALDPGWKLAPGVIFTRG